MTKQSVRRIQVITFIFVHIPLAAIVIYSAMTDLSQRSTLLLVAFLSTLATAILVWTFIGKVMTHHAIGRAQSA